MKKVLMGTSALVALGAMAASPAAAEDPIKLSVGGYWQQVTTFVSVDELQGAPDFLPVNVRQEGEIHFKGETTLDNGLTVGVQVQLEGVTQSDQIDESYMYFSGDWGRIILGAENAAPYLMQYSAPSVAWGVNSPNFMFFPSVLATTTFINGVSDANKITYFTPRFGGFQFGISYTPNADARGGDRQTFGLNTDDNAGLDKNWISIGANFVETFNGVDVAVAGGYERGSSEEDNVTTVTGNPPFAINTATGVISPASTTTTTAAVFDDRQIWSLGANFGFAGFTVGGSYYSDNNGLKGDFNTDTWDVGASYSTGPWGISITYLRSETEAGSSSNTLDHDHGELGASYALGPGITVAGAVQYWKEDYIAEDTDGWAFGIGTKLSF
jgi:predicted porin